MKRFSVERIIIVTASLAVVGAIFAGLYVIGPPSRQRLRRIDERRMQDLNELSIAVDNYWNHNKKLPATMEELCKHSCSNAKDPVSQRPYIYEKTGPKAYKFCADFALESDESSPSGRYYYPQFKWKHKAGHDCFDLAPPNTDNGKGK